MKNLLFNIGLPRSGSTVLMKILNQNPDIFTTGTCPVPYLIDTTRNTTLNSPEFMAMKMDSLNKATLGFIKQGMNGWYSSLTEKPTVVSKSRVWVEHFNTLFALYEKPKFIVSIRDLRDIVASYEKLKEKYPMMNGVTSIKFESFPLDKRIEIYCRDGSANLGFCLNNLIILLEYMNRYPENFFVVRFEDLTSKPLMLLQYLYKWMDLPYYEHDLNNIDEGDYYEHDTVYRGWVSHKIKSKMETSTPQWPSFMNEYHSRSIIDNNKLFYNTFYPEIK